MIFKYIAFCCLFFLVSCEVENHYSKNSNIINEKENHTLEFIQTILKDTLEIKNKNQEICLNYDLDSLAILSEIDDEFQIIDLSNSIILLSWHPFLGSVKVSRESNKKYEFIGKVKLPKNGNWNTYFPEFEFIKYTLEFNKSGYKFYRNKETCLKLKSDSMMLTQLQDFIEKSPICKSENWEEANSCFHIIEKYEYQLFASILEGKIENKEKYLSLRENISIVNAGQFSEYLEGNYLILALYGIIKQEEYDIFRILYRSEINYKRKKCY